MTESKVTFRIHRLPHRAAWVPTGPLCMQELLGRACKGIQELHSQRNFYTDRNKVIIKAAKDDRALWHSMLLVNLPFHLLPRCQSFPIQCHIHNPCYHVGATTGKLFPFVKLAGLEATFLIHRMKPLTWLERSLRRSQHGGQVSRQSVLVLAATARSRPALHKLQPAA